MEILLSVSPSREIKWAKKKWLRYEYRREQVVGDNVGNCSNVNGNSEGRRRGRVVRGADFVVWRSQVPVPPLTTSLDLFRGSPLFKSSATLSK